MTNKSKMGSGGEEIILGKLQNSNLINETLTFFAKIITENNITTL